VSIKPTDVKQVILNDDDFGHEMRVGHIFGNASQHITNREYKIAPKHGGTYTDLHTGKPREFDYRFQVRNRYDQSQCVLLAVECKNLHKNSPLVICGRSRTNEEAYHALIESSRTGPLSVTKIKTGSFYPPGDFVGKSLVRLKEDSSKQLKSVSESDIYDKWSQALASSVELAERACFLSQDSKYPEKVCSMVMPVVVVPDELLWTVNYDQAGQISQDPDIVEECVYFVDRKFRVDGLNSSHFILTHIHFVTLKGFKNLLARLFDSSGNYWNDILAGGTCLDGSNTL
jgi:hypothetical protein